MQTSSPFSKLFYRSGKLLGKFQDFFSRIQGSVRTLPPAIPRNFPLKELRSYRTDMRDSQSEFCQDDVPLKRKCLCYNSCRRPLPFRFGKSLLKSVSVWNCFSRGFQNVRTVCQTVRNKYFLDLKKAGNQGELGN